MMRALLTALAWLASVCAGVSQEKIQTGRTIVFSGICDASAAVALDQDLVAIADDEDNAIRVYSRRAGGMPVAVFDFSSALQLGDKAPEADLEAATRLGDRIYWMSSHGRNAEGKLRPNRHQFFATTAGATNGSAALQIIGASYHHLLADLIREPGLARFELGKAALRAPKTAEALNIEGLAATADGHLLIGFRNPIPEGRALLVPMLNPDEVIKLQPPRFGTPLLLDLEGLGIRSITGFRDRFFIIAGRPDGGGKSRLFEWQGGSSRPRQVKGVDFRGFNPEAITIFAGSQTPPELFITSDDGTVEIGGKPCKNLKNPKDKSFRALSFTGLEAAL